MKRRDIAFEESLSEDWSNDLDVIEVSIGRGPMVYLWAVIAIIGAVVLGRMMYLGVMKGDVYSVRAESNLHSVKRVSAPRGLILDRYGKVIADNRVVFRASLDVREYMKKKDLQEPTSKAINEVLGLDRNFVEKTLKDKKIRLNDYTLPLPLSSDLSQDQLLKIKSLNLSTIVIDTGYVRNYPNGPAFSTMLGYTSLAGAEDMKDNPNLLNGDFVGKAGLEAYYDKELQGTAGKIIEYRNAKGETLGKQEKIEPSPAPDFKTTIDADLQEYFYNRLDTALKALDRTTGVGIAMDPRNGEILAMVSMPSFDGNIFTVSEKKDERKEILNSPLRPLLNRAVSGVYAPGSTIKPLVGVAALKEGVISPTRTIFSPGYLEIPNPYNPSQPTRYPDWKYQGDVNLYSAIAQSSNVYFYAVGGGTKDIKGLGITKLHEWWKKFKLAELTGIDLPSEKEGFLPTPDWKQKRFKTPWLLGDTYNVSIGQGDVQITPIQLINYTSALANGGTIYKPHIKSDVKQEVLKDLTEYGPQIKEAQKGMVQTVESSQGTARIMQNLPMSSAGKTGSAQVENKTKENAFFVGYAPAENPQIAILVLIEHSRQGSLNAVPVAKDVLNWYYENRIK